MIGIYIRRDHILEDTLRAFDKNDKSKILYDSQVEFVKEPGIDAGSLNLSSPTKTSLGGLKKEWMTLVTKELFDPRYELFKLSSNQRTIHPDPLSIIQPLCMSYFRLAGNIISLVKMSLICF